MQTTHLESLLLALKGLPERLTESFYRVPGIWTGRTTGTEQVNPAEYFGHIIENILNNAATASPKQAEWKTTAVVYNLFVRLTAAFDHDGDGVISADPLESGFRETGTLLKAIALLPYIKSLGANTLYLLPVTERLVSFLNPCFLKL